MPPQGVNIASEFTLQTLPTCANSFNYLLAQRLTNYLLAVRILGHILDFELSATPLAQFPTAVRIKRITLAQAF